MDQQRMLATKDVAVRLGVTSHTVRNLVKFAGLPAVRLVGSALRYESDSVESWIAARRVNNA